MIHNAHTKYFQVLFAGRHFKNLSLIFIEMTYVYFSQHLYGLIQSIQAEQWQHYLGKLEKKDVILFLIERQVCFGKCEVISNKK